jgi:hypothetical protein
VETNETSATMDLPKGTGYLTGMAIGMGSWIVWAIVFNNLVLGFLFSMGMGLLVFGPMFEKAHSTEVAPEQTRTMRILLVLGTLIGVATIVVLFVRLFLMA